MRPAFEVPRLRLESLVREMDQIEDETDALQLTNDIADMAEGIGQRFEFLMSH